MRFTTALALFTFLFAGTDQMSAQLFSKYNLKPELKTKSLAQLEERARTAQDWQTLAQLWESREAALLEKAANHDRLKQRYASGPKSLIAKRGNSWDTPRRQAELAAKARTEAALAGDRAAVLFARADAAAVNVD
jgi:hypothetical protein